MKAFYIWREKMRSHNADKVKAIMEAEAKKRQKEKDRKKKCGIPLKQRKTGWSIRGDTKKPHFKNA